MSDESPSVCVVTQPLSPAGERISLNLLDILSAITTVSLMTGAIPVNSRIRDECETIEISTAGTGRSILVAALRFVLNQFWMAKNIWRRGEDIILFFGPTSYLFPILVGKLAGKTVVLQPRGDVALTLRLQWADRVPWPVARLLAGLVQMLERLGFLVADAIVTYTPTMADELDLGHYESKLYTSGARFIDTDRFQPTVPFAERNRVVGFLGRIDEEKGIRTLATVAKLLPDDCVFVFAGDGDLSEWLATELEEERKEAKVELSGWVAQEDVPEMLNRFQLLIMPSQPTEGLPTAILEAMACGTPVYATPVAGVPDVIQEGETGFLMHKAKGRPIATDIEHLLYNDNLAEVSENARKLIEEEYGFQSAVERWKNIIAHLDES